MATGNVTEVFQEFTRRQAAGEEITFDQLRQELEIPTTEYFNLNHNATSHNWFFEQFTGIWFGLILERRYFHAIALWDLALNLALDWENHNKPHKIHKGTPYYFLGVTGILNNELENGFLAMHQAMEEDKRLSGRRLPEAPAFWFVILDSTNQNQFFRAKVEQIANYLSERLVEYANLRAGHLSLGVMRERFLRRRRLMDEVFFFVFCIFKLRKLIVETSRIYKSNAFSSILHAKLLFDLSVIADKVIEYKNPRRRRHERLVFAEELIFLSTQHPLLSFNTGNKIQMLNDDFNTDFSGTLAALLRRTYHLPFSGIENDFAITYGIRNFGAHKIENQPCIYKNIAQISQSILNTLFFTIEKIY